MHSMPFFAEHCSKESDRMTEEEKPEFARSHARFGAQTPSLLGRIVAVILGAAFLILAFMFSLVVLVVAVTGGLLAWAYLWWKSRKLRQQIREQPSGMRIIEGEVIRESEQGDRLLR
jgi:Flp pilus assembly protein TadB